MAKISFNQKMAQYGRSHWFNVCKFLDDFSNVLMNKKLGDEGVKFKIMESWKILDLGVVEN